LTKPGCGFIFKVSVEIVKNLRYSVKDIGTVKSIEKGKANNSGGIKWLV
jgi:hypothetical protein